MFSTFNVKMVNVVENAESFYNRGLLCDCENLADDLFSALPKTSLTQMERKLHILTQGSRQKTLSTSMYCRCRKMPRIIKCHSFNCKFLAAVARVPCLLGDSFPVSSQRFVITEKAPTRAFS